MKLDKVLLSGVIVLAIAGIMEFVLPGLGIVIDLSVIKDGDLTWGDLLYIGGSILVAISEKARETFRAARESKIVSKVKSILRRKKRS